MSDELWNVVATQNYGTLATIKKDGRPQLSDINYTAGFSAPPGGPGAGGRTVRISTRAPLAKTHNLRRDPRASLKVTAPSGGYAVIEATAELSAVAADRHDATVEELIEIYRLVQGKEHPDWDDYRRAMVSDERLILRLHVEKLYGWVM
jgi:PPOX class probable F420-dependent enzyme